VAVMQTVEFESAQYVNVQFELASPIQRVAAFMIDFVTFILYMFFMYLILGLSSLFAESNTYLFLTLLLIKLPWIFYHPLCEYLFNGQSLGKYILGIRVVKLDGERIGFREIFTRWVFKGDFIWISADYLFLFWFGFGILGFIFASTSKQNQRIGDLMAGVLIIKKKASVQYQLSDVLSIKSHDNYTPIYPNVIRFTDEDMLLIKTIVNRVQVYPNESTKQLAIDIANKTASLIGLDETPPKKLEFLKTVLQDYVVLTR
jgi:uncharacterized RDD family membrane protein YckC